MTQSHLENRLLEPGRVRSEVTQMQASTDNLQLHRLTRLGVLAAPLGLVLSFAVAFTR
jgi:hypothetical protein